MKIPADLYDDLSAALRPIIAEHTDAQAQYADAGYSMRRYRWDLLHFSKFDTSRLYDGGLDDSHIDTALRAITHTK